MENKTIEQQIREEAEAKYPLPDIKKLMAEEVDDYIAGWRHVILSAEAKSNRQGYIDGRLQSLSELASLRSQLSTMHTTEQVREMLEEQRKSCREYLKGFVRINPRTNTEECIIAVMSAPLLELK